MSAVMHELVEMKPYLHPEAGDHRTIWDPSKPIEVELARKAFNELIEKGYSVFHASDDGEKGKKMKEFDPRAARLIAVAPLAPG